MSDVTNPSNQASNEAIEASIKAATFTISPNTKSLSTDPIPPLYHTNLAYDISEVTDYIIEQTQRHKELMAHVESLRDKLDSISTNVRKYHADDKIEEVKNTIVKERNIFSNLSKSHIIEMVVVGVVAIGIIIAAFKFL